MSRELGLKCASRKLVGLFPELITTQLRDFHMVSPQVVITLIVVLTMQSYKFYLNSFYCTEAENYVSA